MPACAGKGLPCFDTPHSLTQNYPCERPSLRIRQKIILSAGVGRVRAPVAVCPSWIVPSLNGITKLKFDARSLTTNICFGDVNILSYKQRLFVVNISFFLKTSSSNHFGVFCLSLLVVFRLHHGTPWSFSVCNDSLDFNTVKVYMA